MSDKLAAIAAEVVARNLRNAEGAWVSDKEIADVLNAPDGRDVRQHAPVLQVARSLRLGDMAKLTDNERLWLQLQLQGEKPVDFAQEHVQEGFAQLFPDDTVTGQALLALSSKKIAWSEDNVGEHVRLEDIELARKKAGAKLEGEDAGDLIAAAQSIEGAAAKADKPAGKVKRG